MVLIFVLNSCSFHAIPIFSVKKKLFFIFSTNFSIIVRKIKTEKGKEKLFFITKHTITSLIKKNGQSFSAIK
jgi:hypothetical protein